MKVGGTQQGAGQTGRSKGSGKGDAKSGAGDGAKRGDKAEGRRDRPDRPKVGGGREQGRPGRPKAGGDDARRGPKELRGAVPVGASCVSPCGGSGDVRQQLPPADTIDPSHLPAWDPGLLVPRDTAIDIPVDGTRPTLYMPTQATVG